jgi:NarL family two-component system response regulator LiaR
MRRKTADEEKIRVLIVDDHTVVREGLTAMLDVHPELTLVGEAPDGSLAIELCGRLKPNVILMDLMMPEVDGVTAIRSIMATHPEMRILALTSFMENEMLQAALDAGAVGFLLKNISAKELVEAIKAASKGKPSLAPEATQALIQAATSPPSLGHDLTPREIDVLNHLVEGLTNAEIAQRLGIKPSTAKNHIKSIMSKLGAVSRTEAATLALTHKLVRHTG